jgi:hypothetical protein
MSSIASPVAVGSDDRSRRILRRPGRLFVSTCALFITCSVIGVLAFLAGERSADAVTVSTGRAYSNGSSEATISADGWNYGVSPGVSWIGSDGTVNAGTWPVCLRQGISEVTFGWVDTTRTTGQRAVVWLRC